jgi:hypothetical protein
MVLHLI